MYIMGCLLQREVGTKGDGNSKCERSCSEKLAGSYQRLKGVLQSDPHGGDVWWCSSIVRVAMLPGSLLRDR